MAALVGWLGVLAFSGVGSGDRSIFGPLKWSDFVHFYTLGDVARTHDGPLLYDDQALHARQTALVPASAGDRFIAVYGPQTALIFAPLTGASYVTAGAIWAFLTLCIYGWASWLAWRPARPAIPDRAFVTAAILGFPPAWQLVMYGQTTAVLLLAFAGGLWALERGRPLLAGAVLSLIAIKPQWGLVLGAIALLAGEWRLITGALAGVAVQSLATLAVFDASVFAGYARAVRRIPAAVASLEPDAYKLHSARVLTQLLPGPADWIVWSALGIAVVAGTLKIWRDRALPCRLRFGLLVLGSALVNPHVSIYDVTVLALPILWIGGWLMTEHHESGWFWRAVHLLSVLLLFPTAAILRLQLSPIVIAGLYVRTWRLAAARGSAARPSRHQSHV